MGLTKEQIGQLEFEPMRHKTHLLLNGGRD